MAQQDQAAYHKQNCTCPLLRGPRGWPLYTLAKRYEGAVRHFIRTPQGSIYTDLNYGTTLYRLRTQIITREDVQVERGMLAMGFGRYFPDLQFNELLMERVQDDEGLDVKVIWVIRGATESMHGDLARPVETGVLI